MSGAAGRQISSAPPILFKRMGGTKRNNRIFSQKTSVILKRQIGSAVIIVCVQDFTHLAFFAERRAGKMLNMEILKRTQTPVASAWHILVGLKAKPTKMKIENLSDIIFRFNALLIFQAPILVFLTGCGDYCCRRRLYRCWNKFSMTVCFKRKVRHAVPHPNLPQVGEGVLF